MRLIRLNTVVLPAPLGPIKVNTSPRCTSKLTLLTASTPPKRTERSRAESSGASLVIARAAQSNAGRDRACEAVGGYAPALGCGGRPCGPRRRLMSLPTHTHPRLRRCTEVFVVACHERSCAVGGARLGRFV